MPRPERMISLPSHCVLIKNGGEMNIQDYEFRADFGENIPQEEEQQAEAEKELRNRISDEEKALKEKYEALLRQAEDALEDARIKAEEIVQEAQEGIRQAEEDARSRGYDEGYQNGHEQGHQEAYQDMTRKMEEELDRLRNQMRQVIDSVTEEKEKVLERYLDDLKRICLAVSEKIIHTSLRSSGEVIKRMIVAATDKIKKTQWAKIYISKQDSEMLIKGDTQLLKEMAHLTDNLKVVAMENEDPGTCIIELPDEIVDASVNTQMENIKDILNNARL